MWLVMKTRRVDIASRVPIWLIQLGRQCESIANS